MLRDLYLVPGDPIPGRGERGGVPDRGGTPLGPPDPDAEREPNDRSLEANAYRIGRVSPGRLTNTSENDVFRFTLAATERLRIVAEPPTDGSIQLLLMSSRPADREPQPTGLGQPTAYEVLLTPGDYEVELRAETPSEDHYRFSVVPLDPFAVADDQEPNDSQWQARPMPVSGRVEGVGALPSDNDWFELSPSEDGAALTFDLPGDDVALEVSDGANAIRIERGDDDRTWTSDPVPVGVPLYVGVRVRGEAPYTLTLGAPPDTAPPADPPLAASLATAD